MGAGDPASEEQLVERARGGDAGVFEELCQRYEARVQAHLSHLVSGPLKRKVSIADVMQEAYVTAHQRLEDFEHRGDGAFGAWLTRIAELKARAAVARRASGRSWRAGSRDSRKQYAFTHASPASPVPTLLLAGEPEEGGLPGIEWAITAIPRELAGLVWALMRGEEQHLAARAPRT